ncbi:GTP 3',8-cyclase MoaA [Pseudomarimonas arenosa]|uniref:GTP 3',8-cyclase n=1 Tax=Pseudomarimonas arenosa TaxID=2774145 RepID=A0AAW3ZSL0_9GAMM|nr:GTP 3',8-cyclase MoaA [Pseudomarimonas arenosa]MBD8527452.1 GTP 3',8-cyclase MoaA [Pseudomarimonas arenosa]
MNTLTDTFGRTFPYLRLSLTEACNLRCSYCLPDGWRAQGKPGWLTLDEIGRLLRGFAAVGLRKLRLTGGEPSLRRDLTEVIAQAAATPGLRKLALTTNGCVLARRVDAWRSAGLTALNVSLDSLRTDRFTAITGHSYHAELMQAIDHSLSLGFDAVKLNAVLLGDLNDDELPSWLEYLRERRITLRFIELMRTGDNQAYFTRHHRSTEALIQPLIDQGWRELPRAEDAGPARELAHPDYHGRIGIIAPYSKDFCRSCNRLRVTAKGDLRLCLFGEFGIALRPLLQHDQDLPDLVARLSGQLAYKQAGHRLHEGETGLTRHLASVGG